MSLLEQHKVERVRQPGELCPKCSKGILQNKKGKYGTFIGCSRWPNCSHTESQGVNLNNLASELLKAKKKKRRNPKKASAAKKKKAKAKKLKHLEEKKARRELAQHWHQANNLMAKD